MLRGTAGPECPHRFPWSGAPTAASSRSGVLRLGVLIGVAERGVVVRGLPGRRVFVFRPLVLGADLVVALFADARSWLRGSQRGQLSNAAYRVSHRSGGARIRDHDRRGTPMPWDEITPRDFAAFDMERGISKQAMADRYKLYEGYVARRVPQGAQRARLLRDRGQSGLLAAALGLDRLGVGGHGLVDPGLRTPIAVIASTGRVARSIQTRCADQEVPRWPST